MKVPKVNCAIVAEVLRLHGVRHIVCSPGSRNAPLLIAADSLEGVETHKVIDERQAAFIALGMAQTSRQPIALICTSGTALLNYAPAVAEAYYQGLPLIVVSADRPARWIDQDDSQTIRQPGALANFVKKSCDVPDFSADDEDMALYTNRLVNDAMIEALRGRRGPVHINVRISEPLVDSSLPVLPMQRKITCLEADDILPKETVKQLAEQAAGKRVLIVVGFALPDARLNKSIARLAGYPNVYVMHETISNIHIPHRHSAIDLILSTLTDAEREELRPDLVISLGGALISRHVKEYLRAIRPADHWAVGHSHTTVDCFNSLTLRIEGDPGRFLSMLGKFMRRSEIAVNRYAEQWNKVKTRAIKSHNRFIAEAPWCDLKACNAIFQAIPKEANLQISNGTAIRYAQLCMASIPHACFCNRGVSGIDGSLSTAIGASALYQDITVFVTGDMSFAYDISALGSREITERLKIIVLNNQGGGIFRFIPSTSELESREEYFCADPQLQTARIAQAYGFEYFRATNAQQLSAMLSMALSPRLSPVILEVVTPGDIGGEILRQYMNREKKPDSTSNSN